MQTVFHNEILRTPRPAKPIITGYPPPRQHPPPKRRMRHAIALRMARTARRIDDRAAWRAFAP